MPVSDTLRRTLEIQRAGLQAIRNAFNTREAEGDRLSKAEKADRDKHSDMIAEIDNLLNQ